MHCIKALLAVCSAGALALSLPAQTRVWTLQDCLDYALENNIQLQMAGNNYLSGLEDTYQARSARLPSLSASASQGISNQPFGADAGTSYSGRYGLSAGMTLWQDGRLQRAVRQAALQNSIDSLSVLENEIGIRLSIVQAYMQCLYARESVAVSESTAEASRLQMERAEQMWKAGSISKVDYTQLESQHYSDLYQVTSARVNLDNGKLQLKQLLELEVTEEIELADPEPDEAQILALLPAKEEVCRNALAAMPQIERGRLEVAASSLSVRQAQAGFAPSLSASAGIDTGNHSGGGGFAGQLQDNLGESLGLSLSVPIFSNRQNRTAVNKARIAARNSQLEEKNLQKQLLRDVEGTYLDAVSAQAQYISAREKEKYASQSYELTSEQFRLGMKNIVELINAQNEHLSARQALVQAKYMALMSIKMLDIYQGK